MSPREISILLKDGDGDSQGVWTAYRVAGHLLLCDEPLAELEPFRAGADLYRETDAQLTRKAETETLTAVG